MYGIAPRKQHQSAQADGKVARYDATIQNIADPLIIHIARIGVAQVAHILELAAVPRRLQQQCHSKIPNGCPLRLRND